MPNEPGPRRFAVLVALAGLFGWGEADAPLRHRANEQAGGAPVPFAAAQRGAASVRAPPSSATADWLPRGTVTLPQSRLLRAQQALQAYRLATVYPQESQPLAGRSDQAYPNQPIREQHALSRADGPDVEGLVLHTTQERVFVQGQESVRFTLSLQDRNGGVLPLQVLSASAREMPNPNTAPVAVDMPLQFNDSGTAGDAAASDLVFTTVLQPAAQGFARVEGQIRVEAVLQYRQQKGVAIFDIVYSPQAPATWGAVHEAVETGSLNLYLTATVRKAGRYVVSGRVDDATGKPLALLSFNEELSEGEQQVRLTLFGKLLRDARPVFPLTLRDVDGFLLHPDAFPDRTLMPRRAGPVHTTRSYSVDQFSDAEWAGEMRMRYLAQLERDVAEARAQVERADAKR